MRYFRPSMIIHPKYSDDRAKQKAMEDGVDAITASIIDLVATVVHKRLTQVAELVVENIEPKKTRGGKINANRKI